MNSDNLISLLAENARLAALPAIAALWNRSSRKPKAKIEVTGYAALGT